MRFSLKLVVALLFTVVLHFASIANAAIVGPYTPDANTLHLWHLDEAALPAADSGATSIPLTSFGPGTTAPTLGNASYPGFSNAFNGSGGANTGLFAKTPANATTDDTSTATLWNQTTGAFTYEMIIGLDFDPTAVATTSSFYLVTMEQDTGGRAGLTYLNKVATGYTLNFQNLAPSQLLTSSVFSLTQDHYYHVAFAYNGAQNTANNLNFYLTDMGTTASPDTSATTASLLQSFTLTGDFGTAVTVVDLAFGTEARTGSSDGNFPGIIDEIRFSDIARGPDQFIFTAVPEPSSIAFLMLGIVTASGFAVRRRKSEVM